MPRAGSIVTHVGFVFTATEADPTDPARFPVAWSIVYAVTVAALKFVTYRYFARGSMVTLEGNCPVANGPLVIACGNPVVVTR